MILAGLIFVVALSGCIGNDSNSTNGSADGTPIGSTDGSTDSSTNNSTDNSAISDATTSSGFLKQAVLSENGTVLTFNFSSNPTAGCNWTLEEDVTGILSKVNDNFSSSAGVHTWTFKGQAPGIVILDFIYSNASEEGEIEDLVYAIEVKEDKSMEIIYSGSFGYVTFYKGVFWDDNGTFTFEFEENPIAGYSWNISAVPAGVLNKTQDYTNSTTDDPTGESAFAFHTWTYEGVKAGTVKLTFDYRSAEENSTFETAVYDLRVSEDKMIDIIGVSYNTVEATE